MTIGKLSIGYRSADAYAWRKYLIPKHYISPKSKHDYFKFYIRWLNFYFCKPRKCDCCGKYLDSKGGTNFWDYDGNKVVVTVCYTCRENKIYTDKRGCTHTGYNAWLYEVWEKG